MLAAIEAVIAINAIGGAIYGLGGARDVSLEWLEGTPFNDYVVPSLTLLVVVGGGMALAAIALVLGWRRSAEVSMAAGVVLCAWIAMQVVVIVPEGGFSWLQPTMFAAGLGIAIAATRLKRRRRLV